MVKHTQTICWKFGGDLPTNCLNVLDDFVKLALKGLRLVKKRRWFLKNHFNFHKTTREGYVTVKYQYILQFNLRRLYLSVVLDSANQIFLDTLQLKMKTVPFYHTYD